MEEKIISPKATKKILIMGPEGSWKSTILNKLSNTTTLFKVNDLSNLREINEEKNFIKKKVLMDEEYYELYDTIGILPSYKIENLDKCLEKFKKSFLNESYSLILITFPITGLNFDFNPLNLILKTFEFQNNKNVYIVLTQGEKIADAVDRDECYDTFKDELRKKVLHEGMKLNFNNVIIYETNKCDEFQREILLKAEDQNRKLTKIEVQVDKLNYKYNSNEINKVLEKLYTCLDKDNDSNDNNNGYRIFDIINDYLNKCSFLNSPNMII